jgi:hypothetical protein
MMRRYFLARKTPRFTAHPRGKTGTELRARSPLGTPLEEGRFEMVS